MLEELWGAARFRPETGADGADGGEAAGGILSSPDDETPDDETPDSANGANGAGAEARPSEAEALQAAANHAALVVGQVCGLMMVSPAHKHLFVADLEWALMPPVLLRQFSMVRRNGRLAAFVSWASVSDEVDARLQQGVARLKPAEWRSGEHLWIVDVIAPFGTAEEIIEQVREKLFAGKTVKVLTRGAGGGAANEPKAAPAPERGA